MTGTKDPENPLFLALISFNSKNRNGMRSYVLDFWIKAREKKKFIHDQKIEKKRKFYQKIEFV